jgi:two-component system sensor histidine kinase/response regulator
MTISADKVKVLYLDDEQNNLQAFKAVFRREYEVFLALTPEEAYQHLNANQIEVVVSDQRMPIQSGTDFFNDLVHTHPDPIRILLTGFVDIQAVIDAINKGSVYRFLTKPWNENEVRNSIENAKDIFRTRKELDVKTIELQKAYDELDQFVYSASHDLRSPLTTLKGIMNVAKMEGEKQGEYMDMIEQVVDKMDQYVLNIINYYRGNRLEIVEESVNLSELFEDLIQEIKFHPDAKDVKFEFDLQTDKEIVSDKLKLHLIFRNLIQNAVKYQRLDEVNKSIQIRSYYKDGKTCFEIVDNGSGIEESMRIKLFDMFKRSHHPKSGMGLGLFIVHQCVNKLGGEIYYETTIGEGTSFYVYLPTLSPS